MTEIRVAFFLPHLAGGGVERVAVNLAKEFLRLGIRWILSWPKPKVNSLETLPMKPSR